MSDPIIAARELLSLEAARPLTAEQLQRWQSLAAEVFPRDPKEQRTAMRLCGEGPLQVKVGDDVFSVVDMSWSGIAIRGESCLREGDCKRITAVKTDTGWGPLSVAVRVRSVRDNVVGLSLTEPDPLRVNDLFSRAYYPLYLAQLGAIASL